MAASVHRDPTSDENVVGTWSGSVGSRFTLVDDYPDTGGTDVLTTSATGGGQITFGFSAFSLPSIATGITVFVDYYDRKNGSQSCNIGARLKIGGSYFNAGTHNPANGTITQRTDTFATNPATSSAWTPADVNGIQAFGVNSTDSSPSIDVTSIQLRVTYSADYALNAASGSLSVSGQPDGQLATRLLALLSTSFSLSGFVAGLLAGRLLKSNSGSYTLVGADATLTYTPATGGHTLSADPGSFGLSGKSATLLATRLLSLSAGSFSTSGKPAAVLATRLVVASPGSFSISGKSATVLATHLIVASPGSYSISGKTAAALAAHLLVASSGSYATSGKLAAVLVARKLTLGPGSYGVSGKVSQELAARLLKAFLGTYTLAGFDADLSKFSLLPVLNAGPGLYAINGRPASLLRGRVLQASSGTFAVTGRSASVLRSYILVVLPGAYVLIGVSATLTQSSAATRGLVTINDVRVIAVVSRDSAANSATIDDINIASSKVSNE